MCLCMGDSRLTQRSEHFSFTCVYVLLSCMVTVRVCSQRSVVSDRLSRMCVVSVETVPHTAPLTVRFAFLKSTNRLPVQNVA